MGEEFFICESCGLEDMKRVWIDDGGFNKFYYKQEFEDTTKAFEFLNQFLKLEITLEELYNSDDWESWHTRSESPF